MKKFKDKIIYITIGLFIMLLTSASSVFALVANTVIKKVPNPTYLAYKKYSLIVAAIILVILALVLIIYFIKSRKNEKRIKIKNIITIAIITSIVLITAYIIGLKIIPEYNEEEVFGGNSYRGRTLRGGNI